LILRAEAGRLARAVIEYLRGRVLEKSLDHVVLDVNGVGYGVSITAGAFRSLGAEGEAGELFIHTIVREDALQLIGFAARDEREVFRIMLGAKGCGPKMALAALSAMGPARLALAVVERDAKLLAKIPGVGKKTAERMAIDLEAKLKPYAIDVSARAMAGPGAPPSEAGNIAEAIAALEALGCKPLVARTAIEKAVESLGKDADTTALIKEGLKHRR
jgi:Holliday junction DNA helicase RuvA